jgi:hypothetical protein
MAQSRDFWSGRTGFVFATIGAAVGLGSIWKFPYEAGANGGGPFLLFYLTGLAVIVFPLMLVEFAIGRRGRADAAYAIVAVAAAAGASRRWGLCGLLGVAAAFIILSYYSVIGGWAIAYAVDTALQGLGGPDVRAVQARFDALLAAPLTMTAYHLVFTAAVAFIVAGGVSKGIEAACKILMPILIGLIVVLGLFSMTQGDLAATWRFLFSAKLIMSRASENDDRERNGDAHTDHRAFYHCRCVARRNASEQRAIALFLSMVRARWPKELKCPVLLLHELGAVQDNNVRHRRHLRREPVLPRATNTVASPFVGEAAPAPARLESAFRVPAARVRHRPRHTGRMPLRRTAAIA